MAQRQPDDAQADGDGQAVGAVDDRLGHQIAADAGGGVIEGVGGDVEASFADQADDAVAQVFALQEHEDDKDEHDAGRPERADRGSDVLPERVERRRGIGDHAHGHRLRRRCRGCSAGTSAWCMPPAPAAAVDWVAG